jgi:glycosyltransferase involved in cell wall biosynthesis
MLRICQVVASINREVGGPAITVPRLTESLVRQGAKCKVITLDYKNLGSQTPIPGSELVSLHARWWTRRLRGWNPRLRALLVKEGAQTDLIHNHGLWMFPNFYARQAATRACIPLVLSPRGMLEQWSLRRSRTKKFVVWHLFERANLAAAALLHATSDAEASALRKLGLHQPIAVIPNGVDISASDSLPGRDLLERKYPELAHHRWLLFLSRIHPKKGVAELLAAWREVASRFPDWQLILAGPDLDGYGVTARKQASGLGISERVTFTGMLAGPEKESAFANSEVFVLPTHSENFGIAVAEALAFGLPAITTKGAPWHDLETYRCGWWIDLNHSVLVHCIATAMNLPPEELREIGQRGRALMEEKYSWKRVGEQMKRSYEWLLGSGPKPACVRIES